MWWRAIEQQDRGEYFDAQLLTKWITKIQPTSASVWAYLGWNMSYNIAHDFADPDDRWQWIIRAIRLLRDEGLKYNPDNRIIRQELARIFYDRIGGKLDPEAEHFKNQWAFLMMRYFDDGDHDVLERLQGGAASIDVLRLREGVIAYQEAAMKLGTDVLDFNAFPPQRGWIDVDMPEQLKADAALEIYYCYKRMAIENELKLDIDRLVYIDDQYGPFDWRLHQAYTVYWAAEEDFDNFMKGDKGGVNYGRIVRQSMINSFCEGRLFYNPKKNSIARTNNLQIIGRLHDYFDFYMENDPSYEIDQLHKAFLEQAVTILYSFNHHEASRELFGHYEGDYLQGKEIEYEDFVMTNMEKTLSSSNLNTGRSLVDIALHQCFDWLDVGEIDRSNGYFHLAKQLWRRHQRKYQTRSEAKLLPPFEQLVATAKAKFAASRKIDDQTFQKAMNDARQKPVDDLYLGETHKSHYNESNEDNH